MKNFDRLLITAFSIVLFKNTIYQLFLWQLKEYRLDRFLVHLKTWQGRRLILGRIGTVKWGLLFLFPFLYFLFPRALNFVVLAVFLTEILFYAGQLLNNNWQAPVFTLKTVLITALIFFLVVSGLYFLPLPIGFAILLFDRTLLFLVGAMIILTNIPAKLYHRLIVSQAKQKIKNHPQVLTIGITGSYGKSTTKEFLAQILSSKYKVLKTPANINTEIGVAKTILANLKKKHQIFVCEMGAYQKGEIKAICNLVEPKIGLITGLNKQHLALFGSLAEIKKAKFELIEALPEKALSVFNGEDQQCLDLAKKAKRMDRRLRVIKKKRSKLKLGPSGGFFLINFLMAKAVAEELGLSREEINKTAKKLKALPQTMRIIKKKGLTLIDDTYNSNPKGVLAGLDYLKNLKGEKIFVFQPIIELGKASSRIHQQIGKKAAQVCDQIILTNKNYYQDFLKGAKGKASWRKDLPKIKKGAILFEGREAGKLLRLTMSANV